jgi:hypothetical protein
VRNRIECHPAKHVCRVVPLPQCRGGVGIFMSDHGEDKHGKGEDEVAKLLFQVSILCLGATKVNRPLSPKSKQLAA